MPKLPRKRRKSNKAVHYTAKPPKPDCTCPNPLCRKELTEYEVFRSFCTSCRNSFKTINGQPVEVIISNIRPHE